jgi:DNA repair protein RadC
MHLPDDHDPRERLLRHGAGTLSAAELLAVLLGARGQAAHGRRLAAQLLAAFGTLEALSRASSQELIEQPGMSAARAVAVAAAFEIGRRVHAAPAERRPTVRAPGDVAAIVGPQLRHLDREHFCAVLLNTRHEVVDVATVAVGGLDSAPIHPREVFKAAIRRSAAAVILVHNHPSGTPEPSQDDLRITARLADAGRVIGIEVLDHVIIGDGRFTSLRERGVMAS